MIRLPKTEYHWTSQDEYDLAQARAEIARLRAQVERMAGPLAELIIAYQDADSPDIQDTIRRGRAALSERQH